MIYIKIIIQSICFFCSKVISILFSVCEIKGNKVFFYSYRGNKYADNQRSFTEYYLEKGENDLEIVWGYRNDATRDSIPEGVKKVKMISFKYFYHLYTSRFISTNQRISFLDFISKRHGQVYIQTWHASAALKKIEVDALRDLPEIYVREAKRDSKMTDLIISGSRQYSEVYKNKFWYNGPLLEIGTMRNDVLFKDNNTRVKIIKQKLQIPLNQKVVLYAPTFRNNPDLSINFDFDYGMNYEMISEAFEKMIGENIILVKQHPNLKNHKLTETKWSRDITDYQDIQELLLIADVLVTDYSSVLFDFILMKKPLFIYASDFDTYSRDFMVDLNEMPCSISRNNEQLKESILIFNDKEYLDRLYDFDKKHIGTFETGNANKDFYKYLKKNIN
ncbi:CDP-glycerol:poly(glycerophosphate) glycerophosphotransferase [Breznakia blatticola]|uniref:CDP-glycerol:poly(Glycerophosphate) glycerophosphotransferase n=1 Tax=Breznakia blatticola TaxID=1754012 RepID=A0A4R7ZCX0_9FIRM|nr:CDP-glycerol glycerophosphotransferase family protein [Breznakia blatticola]TDW13948.1 CDP-glycerol:poly(glycerophosphate) glycerophosphotransferase [Breznakia blatticola]